MTTHLLRNEWNCTTTPPISLCVVGADKFAHFPLTFTVMQEMTISCGMWSLSRGSDQTDWADHGRWPQHFTSTHNFHGVMLNYRKWIALLNARFEVLTALLLKIPVFWDAICVSGETVPDDADHPDTFMLRVRVKALWPLKMFGDCDRQRHVITSRRLHYFVLLPHPVQQVCGMKRGSGQCMADHISTDTKHLMSNMCFQL